jgi:hypothetical protein
MLYGESLEEKLGKGGKFEIKIKKSKKLKTC